MPISKSLTVRVYQVCNDSGADCASMGPVTDPLYASATNKIWAQAGISVNFVFISKYNSTNFLNIDDAPGSGRAFSDLAQAVDPANYLSSTIQDLFLVKTVSDSSDASEAYGEASSGVGGAVMGMDTILSYNGGNGGLGRIDTFGHEFGHNFGLKPFFLGGDAGHVPDNGVNNQLMSSGGYRNVPATLADIAPDGFGYDFLTTGEINFARQSTLLADVLVDVPVPASILVLTGALGAVGMLRRRRAGTPACAT